MPTTLELLQEDSQAFLRDARKRAPGADHNALANALQQLCAWAERHSSLVAARRPTGSQPKVQVRFRAADRLLLSVYPRSLDGGKVALFPNMEPELPADSRAAIVAALEQLDASVKIEGNGALEVPLGLLSVPAIWSRFAQLLALMLASYAVAVREAPGSQAAV